jgi:ribose 1,5-bisphosphokinase
MVNAAGRLVYVVGPSGSGKDTLLAYARTRMPADVPIAFAHRYITRPVHPDDENHVALSDVEFAVRLARGCMAMHWNAHAHRYGIGIEIDQWLERGLTVVVSGSREYLPQAIAHYADLALVLVTAPAEVLRERLAARGRETPDSIEERLQRTRDYSVLARRPALELVNDGPLERAGDALVAFLRAAANQGSQD